MLNPQMTSSQMELLPLVCLCLLSWSGTTSADQPETVVVEEGGDVILKCSLNGINMETGAFEWTKGQKEVFSFDAGYHHNKGRPGQAEQFKGRVSHFHEELKHGNTSIKITNATMNDSGDYTCEFPSNHPSPTFNVKLVVGRVVVKQDGDVILPCSINGVNIKSGVFDWKKDGQRKKEVFFYNNGDVYSKDSTGQAEQFRGRVAHFDEDELKNGNASIKIRKAKLDDSGIYTCKFPNLLRSPTFHVKLVVEPVLKDRTGENIPGAAPKPSVTILDQTDDWALLQCEADGIPDLEVHWQDSDGNNLTAEKPQVTGTDYLYITLNTTVTKTGNFFCVATQKNISHRISSKIFVHFHGAAAKPSISTLHQTETSALLQCEAHEVPDLEVHWQDSDGKILPAEKSQVTGRDQISITLLTTVTKTGRFRCVATQKNINHTISAETYVYIHKSSGSESVSPLDGLLLLQFLLLFLLF